MKILITGSSSGIGRAVAAHFLESGHEVWGLARRSQVAPARGTFRSSLCDVAVWDQVAAGAAEVNRQWKSLDALVVAAGAHGPVGRALEADPGEWAGAIRTNLDGTYHTLRAFHPLLRQTARRAKIVCFSGGGSTKARANFSAYGAAKTAVVRLVETIAEEERGQPLDINAIAPGAIATRLTDEIIALGPEKAGRAEFDSAVAQKAAGPGPLQKAVGLVDWLLSPASDGISGRLLSAAWDPWPALAEKASALAATDIYTLRRIVPEDRKFTL